jgi:hypothetical protein
MRRILPVVVASLLAPSALRAQAPSRTCAVALRAVGGAAAAIALGATAIRALGGTVAAAARRPLLALVTRALYDCSPLGCSTEVHAPPTAR